jgi:predicted nucleic acid-binding Zn ribbon protein
MAAALARRQKERRHEIKRRQEPRLCVNPTCSKPLPADCRADQTTCSPTCRQALFRRRHRKKKRVRSGAFSVSSRR